MVFIAAQVIVLFPLQKNKQSLLRLKKKSRPCAKKRKQKIDDLRQQIAYLQRENENLWAENNRKFRLVDKFWEQQKTIIEDK